MKQFLSIFFFSLFVQNFAQTQDAWVYFIDKPNASTFLANPSLMLSQRALDRRTTQNIPVDIKDVPIYQPYYNQVVNTSGITVLAKSKWLNCVHVQGNLETIQNLENFSFIDSIEFADKSFNQTGRHQNPLINKVKNKFDINTDFNYGSAVNQIVLHHGDFLHQNNFTGSGMQIAVMDAGFTNVNTATGFQRLFNNNQILGTYNFVDRNENVYFRHYHGTMVLSTMGGFVQDQFVGTAPDASYYLFITEDVTQEHPFEESLWVEAAEKADSLGVDVLNTSLGYTTFDNAAYNHSYEDLDGQTAYMSRGAEIAFSRGMLIINSAGNSANDPWHYIGVPADAPSVLTIGATNATGEMASFSSWGPTPDNRIKPDVCVQGEWVSVINTYDDIVGGSGTSFAGPILAGSATCLWQAYPNKTNVEIAQAIKSSAHLFAAPQEQFGYGIPNFENAFNTLSLENLNNDNLKIFPNPLSENQLLNIFIPASEINSKLQIIDIQGNILNQFELNSIHNSFNIKNISKGIYFIQLISVNENYVQKLIIE